MLKSALERDIQARPFESVIRQFGELIMNDQKILQELDATPDKDSFIDLYRQMAAERGLMFTREEFLVAVQEQKHGADWVIPNKVLLMIAERF